MKRDWAALVFAMVFPAVMALIYFVLLAPQDSGSGSPGPNHWLRLTYAGGKLLQFSFPLLYLWWRGRRLPRPVRTRFPGLRWGLGFGLAIGIVILTVYYGFLHPYLDRLGAPAKVRAKVEEFGLAFPAGYLLLASFIVLIHSFLEEYYWRWFVFGELRRLVPIPGALAAASLAFMAHHVIVLAVYFPGIGSFFMVVLPFALAVALGGAFWCWLYHRTGSLIAPWISHLLIDAAIMAVGYDMLFGK